MKTPQFKRIQSISCLTYLKGTERSLKSILCPKFGDLFTNDLPYFLIQFLQTLFFFEFGNPKVTVHKGKETIQGRKLFKGGNYMRIYGT